MARYHIAIDGTKTPYTAEEETALDKYKEDNIVPNKLESVRTIRNTKLQETDVWVLKGNITDEQKTYRENLRQIPQTYVTEAEYDLLLAMETSEDGMKRTLTHEIWRKP